MNEENSAATSESGKMRGGNQAAALLALLDKTGYTMIQENGQRKFGGPPPGKCFFEVIKLKYVFCKDSYAVFLCMSGMCFLVHYFSVEPDGFFIFHLENSGRWVYLLLPLPY